MAKRRDIYISYPREIYLFGPFRSLCKSTRTDEVSILELMSTCIVDPLKSENIQHFLIAVDTARANGQTERVHHILTPMISELCDKPCMQSTVLHEIEFNLNNTICRSTGQTPSKLSFKVNQIKEERS